MSKLQATGGRSSLVLAWSRRIAVVLLAALVGAQSLSSAQGTATEEFRDPQNRLLGKIVTRSDGRIEARDHRNRLLGTYDPRAGVTYDHNNRVVGRGNFLPALIDRAARESTSEIQNEKLNQHGASRAWREGDPQYEPRYQHRVMPTPDRSDRSIIPPEAKARHGRMAASVTQEDRYFAIDALQKAAKQRGQEVVWRNPDSGNSGSYTVTNDTFETSANGYMIACQWARMVLRAAGEVDVQRQGVCPRQDNGIWVVVTVDADAF